MAQNEILARHYLSPALAAPGLALAADWVLNPLAGVIGSFVFSWHVVLAADASVLQSV